MLILQQYHNYLELVEVMKLQRCLLIIKRFLNNGLDIVFWDEPYKIYHSGERLELTDIITLSVKAKSAANERAKIASRMMSGKIAKVTSNRNKDNCTMSFSECLKIKVSYCQMYLINRLIAAKSINSSADSVVCSQLRASLLNPSSHAKVLSTTHRRGLGRNPLTPFGVLDTSSSMPKSFSISAATSPR